MKLYVDIIDPRQLQYWQQNHCLEVVRWHPIASKPVRNFSPGELVLFKLQGNGTKIVGGGHFRHFTYLPPHLVWEYYHISSGSSSLSDLLASIRRSRSHIGHSEAPGIGCVLLSHLFFLPEKDWIEVPEDFALNASGKTYDSDHGYGQELFSALTEKLGKDHVFPPAGELMKGSFQAKVLDAYNRTCAFTGDQILPALSPCMIRPVSEGGHYETGNGILLRSDLKSLFNAGYLTLDPSLRIRVSPALEIDYGSCPQYYALQDRYMQVYPNSFQDMPLQENLEWHRTNIFMDV